jgi:hypothetical protein
MDMRKTQQLTAVAFDEPAHVDPATLAPWLDEEYTVTHTRYDSRGVWSDWSAVTSGNLVAIED